tara:strand:+ start:224 stop:436 length:213 start_codon:yes stop_codon:yes gene_type:complete
MLAISTGSWYNGGMKNNLNAVHYYALQIPSDKLDYHGKPQYYFAHTLPSLIWQILKHRLWHLKNGDGWKD